MYYKMYYIKILTIIWNKLTMGKPKGLYAARALKANRKKYRWSKTATVQGCTYVVYFVRDKIGGFIFNIENIWLLIRGIIICHPIYISIELLETTHVVLPKNIPARNAMTDFKPCIQILMNIYPNPIEARMSKVFVIKV